MSEQLKMIGERLAAQREIMEISVEEMAKATGITVEEYGKYERGELDFSFSFLYTVAGRLGIDVMDIITGEAPHLNMATMVRKNEGTVIERRKAYRYQHLAYSFRNRKAEPFMVTVAYEPGGKLPKVNVHEGQEFDYLLEGKLRVSVGGIEYLLSGGDSIYYDSSYPHAMQAIDGDAKFLAVVIK
ncbi:MAG: helix-turn-helix domain-containing protein [Christensenellales bacterium]